MGVYSELKAAKKTAADDDYFVYYTYRKISTSVSALSIKLGFSANYITFLSMVADFLVVYLMYIGAWVWAGILVHLAPILDCSDGEVARYNRAHTENPKETRYGGYLDEVLGTIGFTLVIFFAGYLMNNLWAGFFAMFGLFMVLVTSLTALNLFKNKKEIAQNFEKGIFGNLKGRIGFGFGIQRLIISLAVIFQSVWVLWAFAVLANAFWILKFWLYRNQ